MTDQSLIKTIANIITNNLITQSSRLNKPVDELMSKQNIIDLATYFNENKINNQGLSKAIEVLVDSPSLELDEVITKYNLIQNTDTNALQVIVDSILENNPAQVEQYKTGKVNVIGFLVGQCMKQASGNGNPKIFNELLVAKITTL